MIFRLLPGEMDANNPYVNKVTTMKDAMGNISPMVQQKELIAGIRKAVETGDKSAAIRMIDILARVSANPFARFQLD